MLGVIALKVLVIAGITLASAIGVWAPLYLSQSRRPSSSLAALSNVHADALSLCNCLSAGMLLANALGHFFPDAFSDNCISKADVSHLSLWLLLGVLLPAMLNRLAPAAHSHSGRSTPPLSQSTGALTTCLASNALMLVLLMCFHFATEGMLVGVETTSTALVAIAIPLLIHRFFDGVVVGVSLAKERDSSQRQEPPYTRTGASASDSLIDRRPATPAGRSVCGAYTALALSHRVAIGLWLLVTPAAFVVTETLQLPAHSVAHAHGSASHASLSNSTETHESTPAGLSAMSAVKAFGSGSFIFVALELLSEEELTGLRPSLALLVGVGFALLLLYLSPDEGH